VVPKISQETLAEMIGTTRSRVSFFMNRFRRQGFIDYHAGDAVQVHSSLLNIVLLDQPVKSLKGGPHSPGRIVSSPEQNNKDVSWFLAVLRSRRPQ
jgi:hypothetical protein